MNDTTIVIPSAGRASSVRPVEQLPAAAYVAVPASQRAAYERRHGDHVIPVPDEVRGIAATRQWLTDWCPTRYLLQVSDDVTFFRRQFAGTKLVRATGADMVDMCDALLEQVRLHGHAGISARGGNNRVPDSMKLCGRMCDVYVHDVRLLRRYGIRWDRQPVMEDFDVTLNLLRRGHPNAVLYDWCWDQPASNSTGGCSAYRTPQVQMEGALALEYHHPEFVKAAEKPAKNWVGFNGTRWDVTVQWQRAYEASKAAQA